MTGEPGSSVMAAGGQARERVRGMLGLAPMTFVRDTSRGGVVYVAPRNAYFSVDETGRFIVDLLRNRHTLDSIVDAAAHRWQVPADRIRADVTGFVQELLANGVVNAVED